MKILHKGKDGGPESSVTGYWLVEIKSLFSIVLLRFDGQSRDAFHEHAFNSWSVLLKGTLVETFKDGLFKVYQAVRFIKTRRETYHKVDSLGVSWVLSFRGPWYATWKESTKDEEYSLTHGRVKVEQA